MSGSDRNAAVGAEPWDTEWAAVQAAEALRYLGRNAPWSLRTRASWSRTMRPHTRPTCAAMRSPTLRH